MHVSSSTKFWDGMNEQFYSKYARLDAWHKELVNVVMAGSPIEGPMGRSWSINIRDKHGNVFVPWTTLSNYPVQGTGADIMMLARIMAKRRIDKAGIPCVWISTVHDSIVLDCEVQYLQAIREIFDGVFKDLPKTIKQNFNYDWIVPMQCESKFGPNMKNMSKFA